MDVVRCEVCREVVAIVPLLRDAYAETREEIGRRDVPLPSAGQIWWRAAVHARAEAARAAGRPLVWGYGATAACAIGLLAAGASVAWPSVRQWFGDVSGNASVFTASWLLPAADMVIAALRAQLPIVIGVAAFLIAMPVALYFALREE